MMVKCPVIIGIAISPPPRLMEHYRRRGGKNVNARGRFLDVTVGLYLLNSLSLTTHLILN